MIFCFMATNSDNNSVRHYECARGEAKKRRMKQGHSLNSSLISFGQHKTRMLSEEIKTCCFAFMVG